MKPGDRSFDDIDGLADQTAGPVIFVNAERHCLRRRNIEQRMLAESHSDGKGFAGFHRFFVVHLTVLSRRDIKPHFVLVLQHDAVAADVFNAGLRIARDDQMSSAQIASPVTRMPARHWKLHEIHLIAPFDVLEYRTIRNHVGFDRLHCSQSRAQGIDQRNDL